MWVTQLASGRGHRSCSCSPASGARVSPELEQSDKSWRGERPSPVRVPAVPSCLGRVWGAGTMAGFGDGEHSMSILKRLLANAALRDEAGRLRSPEARVRLPSAVSQGVWSVGCREPWLGLPPVPEGGCPVSAPPPPLPRIPQGSGMAGLSSWGGLGRGCFP